MTAIVHTQKQFNAIVATTKKNLESQGNQRVTRRELEKALAPALSDGQSHEALIARLKSEPKTTKGIAHKMIEKAEDNTIMLSKLNSLLIELSSSVANLSRYNFLMSHYRSDFTTALEMIPLDVHPVVSSVVGGFTKMLKDGNDFDTFSYELDNDLEVDLDDEVLLNVTMINGTKQLHVTVLVDVLGQRILSVDTYVFVDKNLESERINTEQDLIIDEALTMTMQHLIDKIGVTIAISNNFTPDVSPELLRALIAECQ